jgi:hypothetical protein
VLKFFSSFDYYISFIYLITFLGGFAFWKLSKEAQKKTIHRLLFGSLLLVFFYENLAYYLVTKRTFNVWVYLIFFHHVAACLNLLIIQEFLLERKRKLVIRGFLGALLLFSGVPLLLGIIPITDSGEYTALLGASFIIISSWMFFYELLLDDRYLAINPIRYSGFWIVTILLFLYSGSFTILISYSYLINNYVDMYYIVIEVTKFSALMLYLSFFLTLAKWKGFTQIKPTYSHE